MKKSQVSVYFLFLAKKIVVSNNMIDKVRSVGREIIQLAKKNLVSVQKWEVNILQKYSVCQKIK